MQRRIAFCVEKWSSDSTLFSWTFAKQFFLRKQRDDDKETLSALDTLLVVHVGRSKEAWDAGGPILPRLSTALENYPHTIVELDGRDVASTIVDWAAREHIDILIVGSRDNKNAAQKMLPGTTVGSISESIKARSKIPCLIIRPSSARNERMRIKSMRNLAVLGSDLGQTLGQNLDPRQSLPQTAKASLLTAQPTPDPRRVCIAFEHADSGQNMVAWAAKHCIFPDDDIYLVHCTNMGALEKMQKSASFSRARLKARSSREFEEPASEDNIDDIGREELRACDEPMRIKLKGDAKSELVDFALDHHIDLLIVGFSAASRMKKALTGGSLSTHLLQHCRCPILVIPLKAMAWDEHDGKDTLAQVPEIRTSNSGGLDGPSLLENEAISPRPSLGPRVSISRSLSHQLSQASNTGLFSGRRNTTGAITGSSSRSGFPPPRSGSTSPDAVDRAMASSSLSPVFEPKSRPSPFEPVARSTRTSTDSGSAEAVNNPVTYESQSSVQDREVLNLKQQLKEKSARVNILEEELRQLRAQMAGMRTGSSGLSSGRVSFAT